MALGKIVIASKFSGIIEQITHEKTGFLFNKGNHESLADLMIDFIQNKHNLNEMGLESKKNLCQILQIIFRFKNILIYINANNTIYSLKILLIYLLL